MPPTTRSQVRPAKKVRVILNTNSRPRFMRKLPLELREMIYEYLIVPRTIEVDFIPQNEADARSQAIESSKFNANINNYDNTTTVQSKYANLDDGSSDPSDDDYKKSKKHFPKAERFIFVNTSDTKLVLHAINRETRYFALKRYTHIFKTPSSPGLLFNFKLDYLAFTGQSNASENEMRYRFVDRKGFQQDITRIQNLVYLFSRHYKELNKIHHGTANARTFVTRFPALKNVIITLPLEHFNNCILCNRTKPSVARIYNHLQSRIGEHIDDAKSHFQELQQKLKDAGIEWVAPELVYKTYCLRQRWALDLEDKGPKKS